MTFNELKTFTKSALIIIVLFLVFSYFLAMFLGPTLFFFTPEGLNSSMLYVRGLPIWLFTIVGFGVPFWLNVRVVFLFIWGVFVICFVSAWQFRESLREVIGKSFSRPMKKLFDNCLFALPVIASMMLVAVIAIQSFQEAGGIPTGEAPLPENPFQAFLELSWKALFEELGFRAIPIGAFMIIYLFWVSGGNVATLSWGQRLKLLLTAPVFPERAKKMVGVKTVSDFGVRGGINLGEWAMILFTSIIFGLAHYLGGGWNVGKITLAFAVALTMGLTYLLYGIQAPILLHWFFNYHYYAYYLASELYTPMLIAFVLIYSIIINLGRIGWLAVMILGFYKVFITIAKRVKSQMPLSRAS